MRNFRTRVAIGAAILCSALSVARAAPITLTFEELLDGGLFRQNFMSGGFVFSPQCHYDVAPGPSGKWLGYDGSGCDRGVFNSDYLGSENLDQFGRMFVAAVDGSTFSLVSLNAIPFFGGVTSSKGAITSPPHGSGEYPLYVFSDPDSIEVDWLVFRGGTGAPIGIDNLTLTPNEVPEPSPASLLFLALFIGGLTTRLTSRKSRI